MFASVCPLYPPSVDDYYYLLWSQHINKIIKKKFCPFKRYQYFHYNIKICTEFQLKCATCFCCTNYQDTPSSNILYPNTTFWTGNFLNFGSKRLYCTTILAIQKITFQKIVSKMHIFTSKNDKFGPFFKF